MKAAKVYAEKLGWAVVPLHDVSSGNCSCGKNPCKSAGKHPRIKDWVKSASKEPGQVERWIAEYQQANVGIVTGDASGFFVLDVDPEHGGNETLAALIAKHGPLPETVTARTGSGGTHYLFKMIPGLANSASKLGAGLDTRANGGQIVAAPSKSLKGSYTWVRAPWQCEIADAPAWLVELLTRALIPEHAPVTRAEFPPASPEVLEAARDSLDQHGPALDGQGGGLHTVQAAAILTHDYALTDAEAWPLFCEWNETCDPPWALEGQDSLRVMLGRGRKYGKAEFGCKRKPEPLPSSKLLIEQWRTAGSDQASIPQLVERVRDVVAKGSLPSERALIEQELKAATGLSAKALALPAAQVRNIAAATAEFDPYNFDTNASGQPIMNLNNVLRVLEFDKPRITFDTFLQKVTKADGKEWTDKDTFNFTVHLQRDRGLTRMPSHLAFEGVVTYAQRNQSNCVAEYLEALKWDGTKRINAFMTVALGAADNEYTRSASQNFWRSMVARALNPGCKVDNMIVLEGPQGILKSSALKHIAGAEWFAEAAESPHSKDFFQGLNGKLLIEIAELDSFSRADVTAVKRVLSCQSDRYRPPYGRVAQDFPRQGIFAGTTNRDDWSRDDTGARRFWPIVCSRISIHYIQKHRDQLFAEAVHDVRAGENWWTMPAEATAAEQDARLQADPWQHILEQYLSEVKETEFTVPDLLANPIGLDPSRMGRSEQMRAAGVLKRIGLHKSDVWRHGKKKRTWRKLSTK